MGRDTVAEPVRKGRRALDDRSRPHRLDGSRSIGEAATRTGSTDPDELVAFMRGPEFGLGAFKGQALTFRDWDGQMRQPILLAGPRMLISVSPQDGFLHPGSLLDTLGDDRPESACRLDGN